MQFGSPLYTVFAEFPFTGSAPLGTHSEFRQAFESIDKLRRNGFQMRLVRIFEFPCGYVPSPEDIGCTSRHIVFQEENGKRIVAERFHQFCPSAGAVREAYVTA